MSQVLWTRTELARGVLVFGGLITSGFVAMLLGWKVAAGSVLVSDQVPVLVAGGLGGLGAVILGAGLANAQSSRHLAAAERAATDLLITEARALVELPHPRNGTP